MPIPCPCCRASNDAGPNCRRCKADLSLLFQLEASRAGHMAQARKFAAAERYPEALESLAKAGEIRRDRDVIRLTAAIHLMQRDFPAARNALHRIASTT